jgi:hypothetical protein
MIQYKSKMQPIPFDEFSKRTGFTSEQIGFNKWTEIAQIVAPTDLNKIISVQAMPMVYLKQILSKIGTLGEPENKVYAEAKITLSCIDPNLLLLGQKFIYRKNYTAILENFRNLFTDFAVLRGISKLTAYIIVGQDRSENLVLAQYLPPIIEVHNNKLILLDGVHRNFIAKQSGTNTECIIIEGIKTPFPCAVRPWEEIKIVDEKPENMEERYFDLKKELFRDLKSIGIDG